MGQEDVSAPIWSGHGKGKLAPDPGDSLSNYRGCILRQQQSPASHFLADIPCNWKLNYDDDDLLATGCKSSHLVHLGVSDLIHQTEMITIARPRIPDWTEELIRIRSNHLALAWIFN